MSAVSVEFERAASVPRVDAAMIPLSGTWPFVASSHGDERGSEPFTRKGSDPLYRGPAFPASTSGRAERLDAHGALEALHHVLFEELVSRQRSIGPGSSVVTERRQPRPAAVVVLAPAHRVRLAMAGHGGP